MMRLKPVRSLGRAASLALLGATIALPASAQELKPWRNALIQPKADAGFYLMASKRGFFEKEGLKVETLEVKDDTIGIKALLSGEVDSYFGTAGALAAVARGADVKFVGCPWHGIPYVVLGRAGHHQDRRTSRASRSPRRRRARRSTWWRAPRSPSSTCLRRR